MASSEAPSPQKAVEAHRRGVNDAFRSEETVGSLADFHVSGRALPDSVRARMEAVFHADLSTVRVHEGAHVGRLDAVALTSGEHIHFATGRFRPESAAGRAVLGHELAHVMQQRAGRVAATGRLNGLPANQDRRLEAEADRLGQAAATARGSAGGHRAAPAPPVACATPAPPGPIQRLAVDDFRRPNVPRIDPVTLNGANDSVRKSGAGVTGVYFVRQNNDQIVLKFVDEDAANRAMTADQIIRSTTNVRVADSVAIAHPEPSRAQIGQDVLAWAGPGGGAAAGIGAGNRTNARLRQDAAQDTEIGRNPTVLVMEMLDGATGDHLAANNPDELLRRLSTATVQRDLATLLVMDALLGNRDRMQRGPDLAGEDDWSYSNTGNLFFSDDGRHAYALDNDVSLGAVNDRNAGFQSEMVGWLTDGRLTSAITGLFRAIVLQCHDDRRPQIAARLFNSQEGQDIRGGISRFVREEMKQVSTNASNRKNTIAGIVRNAPAPGDGAFEMFHHETFEFRRKFLKRLVKGKDSDTAKQGALEKVFG